MTRINITIIPAVIVLFLITAAIKIADAQQEIDVHAFAAQGFLKTDKNNFVTESEKGSFELREMGINVSTAATPALWFGIQLFARDLGDLGNDELTIDWVYGDYLYREWLGLRMGTLKVAHGLYNESRDSDMARASIFLPQSVYNEAWRDTFVSIHGLGLYGNICGHMSYEFQTGKLNAPMDGSMVKLFDGSGYGIVNDLESTNKPVITGSVQFFDLLTDGLKLNASFMDNHFDMYVDYSGMDVLIRGDLEMYSTGIEYVYNRFTFASEWVRMNWSFPMELKTTGAPLAKPAPFMTGWYASAAYRFTSWFELGTYYSEFFFDKDDKYGRKYTLGAPYERYALDACLSLRFDLNTNWALKIEGHTVEGAGTLFVKDNIDRNGNKDFEKYWNLFAIKVIFNF